MTQEQREALAFIGALGENGFYVTEIVTERHQNAISELEGMGYLRDDLDSPYRQVFITEAGRALLSASTTQGEDNAR